MMKGLYTGVALVIVSILLAVACAPRVAPTPPAAPAPAPVAPAPAAPAPTPTATPAPTPAAPVQTAWDKVVAAAKAEGKVVLYTFGLTGDPGAAVFKAFEEKYGIKMESVTGVGTVLIERIRSERAAGKPSADTLDTSSALIVTAKRGGLTEAWGDLPVLSEKAFRVAPKLDEEGHALNFCAVIYHIYANTGQVKPEDEPKSWMDLLDPKWKNKITIDTPVTSPMWPRIQYLLVQKNKVLPADYVQKIAANQPRIVATVRDPPQVVARGETPLGVSNNREVDPMIAKGVPIKPIGPREGTVGLGSPTIALIKGAEHPNAARLFINWFLGKEGQTVYTQALNTMCLRTDTPDFRAPGARVTLDKIFWTDVASETEVDKIMAAGTIAEMFGVKR